MTRQNSTLAGPTALMATESSTRVPSGEANELKVVELQFAVLAINGVASEALE